MSICISPGRPQCGLRRGGAGLFLVFVGFAKPDFLFTRVPPVSRNYP